MRHKYVLCATTLARFSHSTPNKIQFKCVDFSFNLSQK